MITLDLPKDLEQLLDRFGVSKEEFALRAIKDQIEDLAVAEAAIAADDGDSIPLSDIIVGESGSMRL